MTTTVQTADALRTRDRGTQESGILSRVALFATGMTMYAIGVAGLVALILATFGILPFTGGPVSIGSTAGAIAFNLSFILLFGVQHAIMARPAFKQRWTQIVSPAIERSIFTMLAGGIMGTAIWLWQPLPQVIWSVEVPAIRYAMYAIGFGGFAYTLLATFAIDHFELFGVKQVFRNLRGADTASPAFVSRLMYKFDRHPIMTGFLIGLWCAPTMTLAHMVLSLGLTAYMIVGVRIEERDLIDLHGEGYLAYKRSVGTTVPFLGRG